MWVRCQDLLHCEKQHIAPAVLRTVWRGSGRWPIQCRDSELLLARLRGHMEELLTAPVTIAIVALLIVAGSDSNKMLKTRQISVKV